MAIKSPFRQSVSEPSFVFFRVTFSRSESLSIALTSESHRTSIFGFSKHVSHNIGCAERITAVNNIDFPGKGCQKNSASSSAESLPLHHGNILSLKKKPSQVAHQDTP